MDKRIENILITCASGSASIYLARKLKNQFNIFLTDATDQSVGSFLGLPFQRVPFGNSPDYLPAIKKLIKEWAIDYIVPGADEELLPIDELRTQDPSIIACIPFGKFIGICLNKKRLMNILHECGISHLLPFNNKKDIHYPVIAKPIYGRGSRQVHKIDNPRELDGYLKLYRKKFNDVLVQPCIDGEEYTISLIVNNKNNIIGIVPKRVILKRGITRIAQTENNTVIKNACKAIVQKLQPYGPCNVQLKLWGGKIYIFEINPRLSTTSVLTDQAFGNEVALYLKYYNRNKILSLPMLKDTMYLFRYEENYFRFKNRVFMASTPGPKTKV